MEIILIGLIIIFIISYRTKKGESVYKFISEQAVNAYKKMEPYSFKAMREKSKRIRIRIYTKTISISNSGFCWIVRRHKLSIFL